MKKTEPTERSLREIPEIDVGNARRLPRGKYTAKAHRSFEVALVEPELFAHFGSSEAINAALRALVDVAGAMKRPVSAHRRRRSPKRSAA